jgi:hypothetical protein
MNVAEEIFEEYVLMRENGLDATTALNKLRPFIDPLSKANKKILAQSLRTWEDNRQAKPVEPERVPGIKPLGKSDNQQQVKADWITCSNCGEKSRSDAVFCWSCGQLLENVVSRFATKHFTDSLGHAHSDYFGPDSVLVMRILDTQHEFEVRPQVADNEIYIGRVSENATMTPDIDLTEIGAEQMGVSRLHMSMKWVAEDQAIQIYDLGSVNGTLVNGQKLHPREVRVLRDGDEIQLGRLRIRMDFHHPGDEVR